MLRPYLGFVPLAVVGVPFLVAAVYQALFSRGCMDGFGYVLIAMAAFMVGGVLNVLYLLVVTATWRNHFLFEHRWQRMAAKTAFSLALLLLLIQVVVLASIGLRK